MITEEQQQRLKELTEVFLEENQKLNLSAFRTFDQAWIGNILDSVAALEAPQFQGDSKQVLDIGTGGGFPLLPLAVCLPNWQFTGLDSIQKKIDAIGRIAAQMQLQNVTLICGRTEELGHDPAHREQYDLVTSRAVAPLNTLLEFSAPFVKVGGFSVAWKSLNLHAELEESLAARTELSSHLTGNFEYDLGGDWPADRSPKGVGWGQRQLLFFEKTYPLDQKYPREVGVPKKEPIV